MGDAAGFEAGGQMEQRKALLEQLRRVLPESSSWEAWLQKTGELPPLFDELPSSSDLPDLLRSDSGLIASQEGWDARREELKDRLQEWIFGRIPPRPDHQKVEVLSERRDAGARVREARIEVAPGAAFDLELMIPEGDGPFPVFVTQHNHRGWALVALQRGYLACVYAGSDSRDDTDSFVAAYPEYDWSRLARRAWAGSRCVDYLESVPDADLERIVITGHSRNGKLALLAAAMDERFAAVISSSSGAGGSLPARIHGELNYGEGIEQMTRTFPDWFHPRWRFFSGREDRLPVDLDALVALAAPRSCLLSTALNDGVENTWVVERTYRAVRRVYELLGAEERFGILWRAGSHEISAADIERYLDWTDAKFGRGGWAAPTELRYPELPSINDAATGFPREIEQGAAGDTGGAGNIASDRAAPDAMSERPGLLTFLSRTVRGALGHEPPEASGPLRNYGVDPGHVQSLLGRTSAGEGIEKMQVEFGDYLCGTIYMPAGLRESGGQAPGALWLPPMSTSHGYAGYYWGEGGGPGRGQVFQMLAQAGFAVFCFDPIGCGRRVEEIQGFERRYPNWSLMGKMVRDAGYALDALDALPFVRKGGAWTLGFSLGAAVGLHLAVLDDRVAGLAAVCPPGDSGRTDVFTRGLLQSIQNPDANGGPSVRSYDLPTLFCGVAPRPLLILTPGLDAISPDREAARGIDTARAVYNQMDARERLSHISPEELPHFPPRVQRVAVEWLSEHAL